MPERSWRCSTLFHQRSPWFCTMAGSSVKTRSLGPRRSSRLLLGAGDGGEELPAGKDGGFASTRGDVGLELDGGVAAFEGCGRGGARAGEAGVDGGEELSR